MFKVELRLDGAGLIAFSWDSLPVLTKAEFTQVIEGVNADTAARTVTDVLHDMDFHEVNSAELVSQVEEDIHDRIMIRSIEDSFHHATIHHVCHMSFMCGPLIISLTIYHFEEEHDPDTLSEEQAEELAEQAAKEKAMFSAKYDLEMVIKGHYHGTDPTKQHTLLNVAGEPDPRCMESTRRVTVEWNGITGKVLEMRSIGFAASQSGVSGEASGIYSEILRELDTELLERLGAGELEGAIAIAKHKLCGVKTNVHLGVEFTWKPHVSEED